LLETVLEDEPGWREILYVEPIELVTGGENLPEPDAPSSLGCSGASPSGSASVDQGSKREERSPKQSEDQNREVRPELAHGLSLPF
jgi:hypothetical protein